MFDERKLVHSYGAAAVKASAAAGLIIHFFEFQLLDCWIPQLTGG